MPSIDHWQVFSRALGELGSESEPAELRRDDALPTPLGHGHSLRFLGAGLCF